MATTQRERTASDSPILSAVHLCVCACVQFAMDAADEAKAAAEAQLEPVADVGDATFNAQSNGGGGAADDDEEEEDEDDEMDDEMDDEGEDEENDETATMTAPGPQGMHVE